MLVTAVGTDNSSCSVFGVAEAQREVSGGCTQFLH